MTVSGTDSLFATQILAVREFNRLYTARLGLLRKKLLEGEFALTEARLLYEVGARPQVRASDLCSLLELDAGYISRLLASLAKRKLLIQARSDKDGREKFLTLTAVGRRAVARINSQSNSQIRTLLENVSAEERESIAAALAKVSSVLAAHPQGTIRIERLSAITQGALSILREYYEAVHVAQRDNPNDLEEILDAPASGIWLAYRGNAVAGCVVLRKLRSIPRASECKRLYVRPSARGQRIADQLLTAQEEFARNQGVEWIYLDSYDDLKAAISLYQKRGYERCKRYNDNPQATLFMRKRIGS